MSDTLVPTPPPQNADDQRTAATIDHWKRKLLDLSKRNRALNFRMNRVSTVAVVDEQPAEIFRRLYLQGKPMRFRAAEEPAPDAVPVDGLFAPSDAGIVAGVAPVVPPPLPDASAGAAVDDAAVADPLAALEPGEEEAAPAPEFAPYEQAALHSRHTDDVLQTTSPPEKLDKSLRRLDEQARETIEEQGVNALFLALGMLHYRESKDSDQVFRAPLVLLPVALARRSASAGYTVSATDEDPLVNPALAEYLLRDFGVALPELPDPAEIADDYDLQGFFQAVTTLVAERAGWTVTTEVYLGLFAFQKFVMYKDLEANGASFQAHRLIRQLVTRSGGQPIGLPEEVREMELDEDFPPERTFQVVDADGSQLRAIAAVNRGYDLVLEGPPGTGKSQTITNLIAQALAAGKTVLFVAEKMAALQVVHSRLSAAGLADFCLELHSTKANKRLVMREVARSLDASLARSRPPEGDAARLEEVRRTLTEYAEAVHTPFGPLGKTPYRGFGELAALHEAPRVRLAAPIDAVTRAELDGLVRGLEDLAKAAAEVEDPAAHPWRDSTRTLYSEDDLQDARALLADLRTRLAETAALAADAEEAFGLPPVRTFADADVAVAVASVLGRSPGAPLAVLRSGAWNAPPPAALEIVERGRKVKELRERVSHRFTREVLDQEHAADVAFIEEKEASFFRFLNFLNGRFKLIRRRWLAYRLPSFSGSLLEQAEEMKKVDLLRREREALRGQDAAARELFGALWQGEQSDWDAVEGYVRWVVEFRGLAVAHRLEEKAAEVAAQPRPDVSLGERLRAAAEGARKALADLSAHVGWPGDYLAAEPLAEIAARAEAMEASVHLAPRWAAFEMVRQQVEKGIAGELLAPAFAGEVAWAELPRAFRRAFFQKWVNAAVQEREPLRAFATMTHEQRVAEFRRLDERVLKDNRDALVARLRDDVQARLRSDAAKEAMPFVQREMAKQRNLAPLRRTLRQGGAAIRAIKPCFMMSPLTVAQLLDGASTPSFDVVIFDEASQLPAEDAVGSILRGATLVVVGDPNQLPPTNFFSVMSGQSVGEVGEDGLPLFEDAESILEEFMGAGVPKTRLRWHYRSTHESLITFSNVSFYDAELHTFPSVETASHQSGLTFVHVTDGVYEGKGLNMAEARRVVDAVVRHAKETPELTLGVGTFNLRQQLAIQDELELRRRQDPSLEPFFAPREEGSFFVKNLENIQGDERDVIFLSVTYGRDREGKLRYNFGPINGENGWRRLNVLTTRARRRMVVFSSMRGDDISPASATSRGPQLLREFLLYAERGRMESVTASAAAETESLFEREVYHELTRRGLTLQPQVGVGGYRIDFGVVDDALPGRFVCGLECDGVAYHASETARDRDRLRQQVLEARGWELHRVWSTDWFKDRAGQVERILRLVGESKRRAAEEAAAANEAEAEEGAAAPSEPVETPETAGPPGTAPPPPLAAEPYRLADTTPPAPGTDILTVSPTQLQRAIRAVVEAEAPLHADDLVARVAAMWGLARAGSRVEARLAHMIQVAEKEGVLRRAGEFVHRPDGAVRVRSRQEVRIPAERIAPEEYREATLRVLRASGGLPRRELIAEVRSLLGFSRTGARLEEAIGAAVDALLADGTAGEGSTGIRLRE